MLIIQLQPTASSNLNTLFLYNIYPPYVLDEPSARALECDLLTLQKDETVQALSVLAQPCAGVPEVGRCRLTLSNRC